jgi:hypothetical protein
MYYFMCVCVCMCVCSNVFKYVCENVSHIVMLPWLDAYIYIYIYIYTHTHNTYYFVCICVYIRVCIMCMSMYVRKHNTGPCMHYMTITYMDLTELIFYNKNMLFPCVRICMCVCAYIYIYIYIYMYTCMTHA